MKTLLESPLTLAAIGGSELTFFVLAVLRGDAGAALLSAVLAIRMLTWADAAYRKAQ